MRGDLINFLKTLNNDVNDTLLNVNIPQFVDKILTFATILTIIKQGELKAFIGFYDNDKNKEVAYLTIIAVCKECWHLGYGKKMLEFSINEIKQKGFKLYCLEVDQNNLNAIKLYKKYGFMRTGVENGIVKMEKRL